MLAFFGHQSVGQDLMTGVAELATSAAETTKVIHLPDHVPSEPADPAKTLTLVHERVGRNREPSSKLAQFAELLRAWPGTQPDVALLKFCYVDVERPADAERLWDDYQASLTKLQHRYPQMRFVHCTVPLRTLPFGLYARVRRMLGHRHPQVAANRAREWFNDRMRERYGCDRLLFDLARTEALRADGELCTVRESGEPVRSLAPEWTYDGGHLNARGRTMAAAAFLQFFQTLDPSVGAR
jgi:hypothetical protein